MCWRCNEVSRRSLLVGGGVAAASLATGAAQARVRPADVAPLIGPGFKPTDKDEQGLWQQMARAEEEALAEGKTLLVLDTADDTAERLYSRLGWKLVGVIPGFALFPDGRPCATTVFYKTLAA